VATSHTPPSAGTRVIVRVARGAGIILLFFVVALLGTLGGVLFAYADDLPEISALDDYRPNTITRVLARDGQVIGEFATERRVVVRYDEIAPYLRQAIMASEDADFEQHFGLSVSRIFITAVKDVLTGQRAGASTITQQVARNLFLQAEYMRGGIYERSLERKIKEAILAVQLEKRYTKPEILAFYANQVPLAHGAYGVEAGARMYFGKSAKDVTLEEAATIAAIVQTPARLSPFVNPDRALARRNNYVLTRMAEEGFITAAQADEARRKPLVLRGQPTPAPSTAPYFVEEVRKELERKYGAAALYEAGLRVQTTLDVAWQKDADAALTRGLRRIDKRRRTYRGPLRNVDGRGTTAETYTDPRWASPLAAGDLVPAVVMAVPAGGARGAVRIRIGSRTLDLPPTAYAWTGKTVAADLFKHGDLIEVSIDTLEGDVPRAMTLDQTPAVEGALVAIDNRTGQIRAMVGGFDFNRSKFNRATQARRQVGSLFKAIVYAAALDHGFTAESVFIDAPVAYNAGAGQPPYSPLNYDRKYEGPVSLRRALEQSRNIPAVKALADIGPAEVVRYARRLGLTGSYPPYLSLALGAAESTLLEMTSAYSAFANLGVRMTPFTVTTVSDREGTVLEQNRPEPHEALKADTAFLMAHLLRGVVQRGTAASANALDWPLAGKTGTMDEYTDAWFIGFDPDITVGVWVGYDEKKPLGPGQTGGAAALPIWADVMRAYLDRRGRTAPPAFEAPGNIVFVTLPSGVTEAFISGTQPAGLQPDAPPAPAMPATLPASQPDGPGAPTPAPARPAAAVTAPAERRLARQ
jgi:penicillin-binding protein 1A